MKRIALLLFMLAGTVSAATLTLVPTGQPGDYTDFATAYAAMNATDTLQVGVTVVGPVTLAKGTFDKHPVYAGGFTSNSTDISSGTVLLNGATTIISLYVENTTLTSGRCIKRLGSGGSGYAIIQNCLIYHYGKTSSPIHIEETISITDILKCQLYARSVTYGIGGGCIAIIGRAGKIENNLIYGNSSPVSSSGLNCGALSNVASIKNNTIHGFILGCSIGTTGYDFQNNVITNCTTPFFSTGAVTLVRYCGLEGSISGYGPGCVSINASTAFVNPSPSQLQDFIPRHDSPIARSGINIPGVTTDILGNPYHNPPSMGAIQCPTSGQDWFYETFQEVSR